MKRPEKPNCNIKIYGLDEQSKSELFALVNYANELGKYCDELEEDLHAALSAEEELIKENRKGE